MDAVAVYSVSPHWMAERICKTILDLVGPSATVRCHVGASLLAEPMSVSRVSPCCACCASCEVSIDVACIVGLNTLSDDMCRHAVRLIGQDSLLPRNADPATPCPPLCSQITDGTACVGGDTIRFAKTFAHVNAVELSVQRANMLYHNVKVTGVASKVFVYNADYVAVGPCMQQDVIFMDPPWGGPEYLKAAALDMFLGPTPLIEVCRSVA